MPLEKDGPQATKVTKLTEASQNLLILSLTFNLSHSFKGLLVLATNH
jgi:hypothetical protein